jgi:hypothetical protein
MSGESKCPFHSGQGPTRTQSNRDWWPNQLNLSVLHQHTSESSPLPAGFNYAEEFKKLDLAAVKKDLYARAFRTPEYFLYEPDTMRLEGFRLMGDLYQPLVPNAHGRLWSDQLELEIGLWQGIPTGLGYDATWVRLFHPDGRLVPTFHERAEAERQKEARDYYREQRESGDAPIDEKALSKKQKERV